jgi:hypothetical protein
VNMLRREWNGVLKVLYGVLVHRHGLNGVGICLVQNRPGWRERLRFVGPAGLAGENC